MIFKYVGIDKIIDDLVERLGNPEKVYITGDFAKGINGEIIDATLDAGLELAQKHDVSSVPTILFFNDRDELVSEASSLDDIKKILENKPISSFG